MMSTGNIDMKNYNEKAEHILVCVSPSPSNSTVIAAAVKMAEAFQATLTALYVKPSTFETLSKEDKDRLENNIQLAQRGGASIVTLTGDDVPALVAEYARISSATKIVVGRSGVTKRHFWSKAPLTEQIILNAPGVDIYIIPDLAVDIKQQKEMVHIKNQMRPTLKDAFITVVLLIVATCIGLIFTNFGFSESNIITVFILGVLIISVETVSPLYSLIGSLASVLLFNWFFINPKYSFHTYETEYAVTFVIMLMSSLITGTLANRLKQNAGQSAREAFRTKILFDTNQLLQKAEDTADVIRITANQVVMLLERDVIIYLNEKDGELTDRIVFNTSHSEEESPITDPKEKEIVDWVFFNRTAAGYRMEQYSKEKAQYHAICLNDHCYGVIAVCINDEPLEPFENSVFMSILGECTLALENLRNAEEKERVSLMVRNEQLRSNLLRSISHDIRTPLTSISGNASNLLSHYQQLDDETLKQIFSDIYDDSEWLIDLVENLLSISRIENGQMQLHLSLDIMDDVIDEALKHVDRNSAEHHITVENSDDILLVNMDSRLIMQVLINLINNAIKNTPAGSEICVRSRQEGDQVVVSVMDNGPGIADEIKPHIFEMFYTGQNKVADGRRGLGIGLALCKSIIDAHQGTITLVDNEPTGCCFNISLPMREVEINE